MKKRVAPTTRQSSTVPVPLVKRPKLSPLDIQTTLFKPFVPPTNFAHRHRDSGLPARKARAAVTRYQVDIADGDEDDDGILGEIVTNEYGQMVQAPPRRKTLGVRASTTTTITTALTGRGRRFVVPLKGFDASGRPPPPALGTRRQAEFVPRPLHDPTSEFAIVLYDPTIDKDPAVDELEEEIEKMSMDGALEENKDGDVVIIDDDSDDAQSALPSPPASLSSQSKRSINRGKSIAEMLGIDTTNKKKKHSNVPVVIDPRLSKILRPHQVEGVKFLYKCTTGQVVPKAFGCIMADEMGLGKTLQCIALLWTLLKQSPQGSVKGTIQKAVIVCPSSLVRNWANEFDKWLGKGALTPLAVDGNIGGGKGGAKANVGSMSSASGANNGPVAAAIRQWAQATGRQIVRPALIISYETLRRNIVELQQTEIGLLLADEGHRLKNGDSLTFTALDSLNVKRRVILSGTPIQNDLSEYFSLLNFANPGLLGTRVEFRKNYELDILRGRDADATDDQVKLGEKKLNEMAKLVGPLIIRRTNDILSKYLPVKYEHVVFCKMMPIQHDIYKYFIMSPEIKKLLRGVGSQPLKAIGLLRKLCTHPDLLDLPTDIEGCENVLPEDFVPKDSRSSRSREIKTWYSGKLSVLERMLARIRRDTNDKIVLISNFTQTLDIIERMCRVSNYGCLRLDGTQAIKKRQRLVDKFNDPENTSDFIFLLSSKAGGCGINLIGANRLILLDPDWNPAADQQALARVWRDGQKKDCFVYRFITTGTIEEKIFQRQSMKQSLSSCVVDENQDVDRLFSIDNLRQLFTFQDTTVCDTHDTFKCKRCRDGRQFIKAPAMLYGDANSWNHFTNPELEKIEDLLLRQEVGNDVVSFVFQYISH